MKRLFSLLACAVIAAIILPAIMHAPALWDMKIQQDAVRDYAGGGNPYLRRDPLTGFSWVYPPYFFRLCRPLAYVDFRTLEYGELIAKLVACVGVFAIWSRLCPKAGRDALFIPFCLIAFDFALLTDLVSGNISVFEQLLLWAGIACLLADRLALFCLLVILASSAKLVLIVFLLLLLLPPTKRRMVWLRVSSLAVLAIAAATWLHWPQWSAYFFRNVRGIGISPVETGGVNPAMLPLVRTVTGLLSGWLHQPFPAGYALAAYTLVCLLVLIVAIQSWRAANARGNVDALSTVFLFCLTYALIVPRFKNYSYILLLLPAFAIMRRGMHPLLLFAAIILLGLPAVFAVGGMPPGVAAWAGYSPLVLTGLLWVTACGRMSRRPNGSVTE